MIFRKTVLVQPELETERACRTHSESGALRFGKAWGNAQKVVGSKSKRAARRAINPSAPGEPSSHTRPVIPGELDASRARVCFTG
jgi:hypothetical protein